MSSGLPIGELAALATALLWTISTLAWTMAGRRIGALAVTFHRLMITCLFLSLHGGFARQHFLPTDADQRTWIVLGLSGLMGFFVSDVCGFKSLLLIGPRLSLLVQSISPPAAAIISWLFLGEMLAVRHWLAMSMTLAGIVWVVLERPEASAYRPPARRHLAAGLVLAATAALAQASGMVLSRMGIGDYDAVAATFIRALGALPAYLLLISITGHWAPVLGAVRNSRAMVIVLGGSIVGPVLGVTLCMIALRHSPAGVVTTLVSTMPVLVLPFTIVLFHERVSLRAALGAIISVAGIALMCWKA